MKLVKNLLYTAFWAASAYARVEHPGSSAEFQKLAPSATAANAIKSRRHQQQKIWLTRTVTENNYQENSGLLKLRAGAVAIPAGLKERLGVVFFVQADILLRKFFKSKDISFPSQLAGCCALFVLLVLSNSLVPGSGDAVFDALSPGAGFLAKWLPVMFVPGLVMLPLAPSVGSPVEILKILCIIVGGFYFTVLSTAYSVSGVRSMQGSLVTTFPAAEKGDVGSIPAKPFSEDLLKKLVALSAIFGALAVAPVKALSESSLNNPFTTASFMCGALAAFVYGSRLPKSFTKIVHPLVTSSFFALVQAKLLALLKGQSLETMLKVFKSGSFAFQTVGAGDLLLFALGPTVISLSLAMYSRKTLMADNLAVVLTGALVSSVGGLFSSAIAVRLLKIASDIVSLSVISRSVTTPLAMAITGMLGGNVPIAISVVVLSGIFGATAGPSLLTNLGIADPLARGLGMGAGAQGVGVAAMAAEKDAFPFAAINMVLTAVFATCLVSVPAVKDLITSIAIGK